MKTIQQTRMEISQLTKIVRSFLFSRIIISYLNIFIMHHMYVELY